MLLTTLFSECIRYIFTFQVCITTYVSESVTYQYFIIHSVFVSPLIVFFLFNHILVLAFPSFLEQIVESCIKKQNNNGRENSLGKILELGQYQKY